MLALAMAGTANATEVEIDGIRYYADTASLRAAVTGCDTTLVNVVIPETISVSDSTGTVEYKVTDIGDSAFYGCTSLASIDLPESLTYIDDFAFSYCTSLTSITLPESLTEIGYYAFVNCTSLTSIDLPNSLTYLGLRAFQGCTSLKSAIIGNHLKELYLDAFRDTELLSLTMGTEVQKINTKDRYNNRDLPPVLSSIAKIIWLPNTKPEGFTKGKMNYVSNSEYGEEAPDLCILKSLSSMFSVDHVKYVPEPAKRTCLAIDCEYGGEPYDVVMDKEVTYKNVKLAISGVGQRAFEANPWIKSARIDCGSILDYAFMECDSLTSVNLGNSVESIGNSAFDKCSSLASVSIGKSVETIGDYAFRNNPFQSIVIPGSTKSLGSNVFDGCANLLAIDVPASVLSIGDYAFQGCTSLGTVNVADRDSVLTLGSNGSNPLFAQCPLTSAYIGGDLEYPTTENAGYSPFYGNTSLRTVTFHGNETEITPYEFSGCTSLEQIELGQGLETIGEGAFRDNPFQSIVIPNSTQSLGDNVFDGCKNLLAMDIPASVKNIGDYAFNKCSSLATVAIADRDSVLTLGSNGKNPLFVACPLDSVYIGGNLDYPTAQGSGYSPFYCNTSLRAVKYNNKETEITSNAFYGCTNLESVEMGDGVTTILERAFSGCSKLESFSFGTAMKTIGEEAFSDCTAMTSLVSRAAEPPVCGSQALEDINKFECTLYVPESSITLYQEAPQWQDFFFVEPTGIEQIVDNGFGEACGEENEADFYDLQGRRVSHPAKGVYIKVQNGKAAKVAI